MKLRSLVSPALLILLLLVLPFLFGFGPVLQGTIPDPDSFLVYGIPWVVVGVVLVGLAKKYFYLSDEGGTVTKAVWAALGYLVIQTLPDIETVAPWLPKYLPLVLATILIFGSQLGLVPGATANKLKALVTRK